MNELKMHSISKNTPFLLFLLTLFFSMKNIFAHTPEEYVNSIYWLSPKNKY